MSNDLHFGRVAWLSEDRGVGVIELDSNSDWHGLTSIEFYIGEATDGQKLEKGDAVKLKISGGRKSPVVQQIQKIV